MTASTNTGGCAYEYMVKVAARGCPDLIRERETAWISIRRTSQQDIAGLELRDIRKPYGSPVVNYGHFAVCPSTAAEPEHGER
jgi:hypothetical protein